MIFSSSIYWIIFIIAGVIIFGIIPLAVRLLSSGQARVRRFNLFLFVCSFVAMLWVGIEVTLRLSHVGTGREGIMAGIPFIVLCAFLWEHIIYQADELTRLRESYEHYKLSGRVEDLKNLEGVILEVIDKNRYFSVAENNELGEKLLKAQESYINTLKNGQHGPLCLQNYYCLGYLLDIVTSSMDKQKVIQIYEKALKCPCQEDEDKKTYKKLCKNIQKRLRRLKRAR